MLQYVARVDSKALSLGDGQPANNIPVPDFRRKAHRIFRIKLASDWNPFPAKGSRASRGNLGRALQHRWPLQRGCVGIQDGPRNLGDIVEPGFEVKEWQFKEVVAKRSRPNH